MRGGAEGGTGVPCPYKFYSPLHGVDGPWVELMAGLGGDSAEGGADGQPLGGSGHAAEDASPFGGADGFVALAGKDSGFGALVGEVALGGGQLGLAGFAVQGEIVERLEILGWDYGLGLVGIASRIGGLAGARGFGPGIRGWRGLQNDGTGQGNLLRQVADDLRRRGDGALLCR